MEYQSLTTILDNYNLLKTVKPRFHQTKFPFHDYKKDKILFTNKTIDILVKADKEAAKQTKKGGDEELQPITFYG